MKDRACACCGIAFVAKAEGQIACTFACARLMVARENARTPAYRKAADDAIAEGLELTRINVAALKGPPS